MCNFGDSLWVPDIQVFVCFITELLVCLFLSCECLTAELHCSMPRLIPCHRTLGLLLLESGHGICNSWHYAYCGSLLIISPLVTSTRMSHVEHQRGRGMRQANVWPKHALRRLDLGTKRLTRTSLGWQWHLFRNLFEWAGIQPER